MTTPLAASGRATTLVSVNGRVSSPSDASVSALDRGFLLGDGVFETMRVLAKAVFRLRAHLDRLEAGAANLGIPVPAELEAAVGELVDRGGDEDGALRLTLSRGPGGEGLQLPETVRPTLVISLHPLRPLSRTKREEGMSVHVASHPLSAGSATAGIKAIGYLPNILALAEARRTGADDGLMLNEQGRLVQGTSSNLFWVSPDGELRTPSAACGILPGITRGAVIELARSWEVAVNEGEWAPDELAGAREAFATSSLRGIAPITRLGGNPIGAGVVGELTRRVSSAYEGLVLRETAAAGGLTTTGRSA